MPADLSGQATKASLVLIGGGSSGELITELFRQRFFQRIGSLGIEAARKG
jgi:hypothetical protein